MEGSLFLAISSYLILVLNGVVYSQDGYIFTMSKDLHEGDVSKACMTAYTPNGSARNITVSLMSKSDPSATLKFEKEYEHGQEKCHDFTVPQADDYIVMVYNETDILHDSVDIKVKPHSHITLLQTDKPMYKPGQKVKFRILTLTSDQKPRKGMIKAVYIKNPDGSRVKQFLDIDSKGIASLEFQLSSEAKLGLWKILVYLNETNPESSEDGYTSFKVKEYVLPRFEVIIKPPTYVLATDETVKGSVCAKYTYGKDVNGILTLKVCGENYYSIKEPTNCFNQVVEINGCYNFETNSSVLDIKGSVHSFYGWQLLVDASVTEHGTGAEVKAKNQGPSLTMEKLKLTFKDETNGFYKPGLPFKGKVVVTKPDGSVAPGELIRVSAFDYDSNVKFVANFTSDMYGTVNYALCGNIAENITSLSLMAEAIEYEDTENFIYTPRTNDEIKQWFSPSFSYIQIPKAENKQKCGSNISLTIPFTTKAGSKITFKYQVIARGKVVSSGSLTHQRSSDNVKLSKPASSGIGCLIPEHDPSLNPEPFNPFLTDNAVPAALATMPDNPPTDEDIEAYLLETIEGESEPVFENGDEDDLTPPSSSSNNLMSENSEGNGENIDGMNEDDDDEDEVDDDDDDDGDYDGNDVVDEDEIDEDDIDSEDIPPPPPPGFESEDGGLGLIDVDDIPALPPMPALNQGPIEPPDMPLKEPMVRSSSLSDAVDEITLDIAITRAMSPEFTLVIYHVLSDGEVVADAMKFEVEPCFDNKVKLAFDKNSVLPGESVNLRLEAEPGSVCGLGIVDKSVNILGGNHQITKDTIYDKIKQVTASDGFSIDSYQQRQEYCKKRLMKFFDVSSFSYMMTMSRYADAEEAFKSSGLLVLTDLKLETRPCETAMPVFYSGGEGVPGPAVPLSSRVNGPVTSSSRPLDVRSHFPETWLWDLQLVGENGTVESIQESPHTVTSWVGNAMCMDAEKGVGVSALQSLTTFQPFFISLNLPHAAVRGERLPVLFTVHNYLDKCLHMQLTLDAGKAFEVHNKHEFNEPFCLCAGESKTARFYATPQQIGSLPIVAKAEILAGMCNNGTDVDLTYAGLSDAVRRKIIVKAEGVAKEYTHTMYMCANVTEGAHEDIILPLQEDIVKDSERGDITIIGDIMGPALTNLNHLVRMPTGCGEQNMVGFAPNIFVLKYLSSIGSLTEKIRDDAIKFMEIGYQRQQNYRHRDGSYSAFGENDARGSVWLTAFVVKSFSQAKPYIFIDSVDLQKSVRFLKLSQSENGCFTETGKVVSSYMMGGLGKKKSHAALTAYVMIALLEAGVNTTETAIVDGFRCIDQEFDRKHMDVYSIAVAAYANTIRNPISKSSMKLMKWLQNKAKHDGSLKYWSRYGIKPPSSNSLYFNTAASAEVEMTAYALLAFLQYYGSSAITNSVDIAMWLSHQRNPQGGFASTQDTVIGLNALSEYALLAYTSTPTNLNITVSSNYEEKTFLVSEKDNTKLLVQSMGINVIPTRVQISAHGEGCALVQANVRFNKLPQNLEQDKQGFHLKVMTRRYRHDIDRCDRRTINIAVGSRGNKKHSNGMSLVMVKMVTGWYPIKDSLKKLKSQFPVIGMKRFEYEEEENVITFYFDEFSRRSRGFAIDVEQDKELAVSSPKPAEVSVINYYERDISIVKSYSLKTICGTKEEIPIRRVIPFNPFDRTTLIQRRVDLSETLPLLGAPAPVNSDSVDCPVCRMSRTLPPRFSDIVCNASAVFKGVSGRKGTYSLKLKQDILASDKTPSFANYSLPKGCQCSLLEPPAKRVIILTSTALEHNVINLNKDSTIMKASRKSEKVILKIKDLCPAA